MAGHQGESDADPDKALEASDSAAEDAIPSDADERVEATDAQDSAGEDAGLPSTSLSTAEPRGMLAFSDKGNLDLSGLSEDQVNALRLQYAEGMIEVRKKASELQVDVEALDFTLRSLTTQTESASRSGVSITATHAQETTLGRTEVILGNTDRAAKGKLTRLQSGSDDQQLLYVVLLVGAIIAGALLIAWLP